MTYDEAVNYLESKGYENIKLGLGRIRALMRAFGSPHEKIKTVHVAGTNGKGSVCAMLKSVLMEEGLRVGMYTSPHLMRYTERFMINARCITDGEFVSQAERVRDICENMIRGGREAPTTFEMLTAMAFNYFYEQKVDVLILEVGLGGKYDATNVISAPILSVITRIGMDHMDFLGGSLREIAAEKGGIIKKNCPAVLYLQNDIVYNEIHEISKLCNSKLYYPKEEKIDIITQNLAGTEFSVENGYFRIDGARIRLLGDYQISNAATVMLACHALRDAGMNIAAESMLRGLERARWKGRMELFNTRPAVLLDGAHNIDGAAAFVSSIKRYFKNKRITILTGVLADKEYEKIMELILPIADKVVVTEPKSSRALPAEELFKIAETIKRPEFKSRDIREAFDFALGITAPEDVVCSVGSLYLIGELEKLIFKRNWRARHD